MKKLKSIWKHAHLTLAFTAVNFLIMMIGTLIVIAGMLLLTYLGIYENAENSRFPMFLFSFSSLIASTIISLLSSHLPLKPIRELMDATDKIADGDYSIRLDLRGTEEFRNLSSKFNHMAEELGSVEMLRTDFVNSFSHEFKTPIVSIRGFAKMLKQTDLTEEEREEYLDIIIQESERLAQLSTNILDLSRIEQQYILTDRKRLNVSEQIRSSIAMMDSKYRGRQIDFQMYGSEIYLTGNESLLKEVWLNLLDNAIKFSKDGGTVKIVIHEHTDFVDIEIANLGEPIPEETARHIFDKFYQADTSHATAGNGLGLAIAKSIVELHEGKINVGYQGDRWVVFTVQLPLSSDR